MNNLLKYANTDHQRLVVETYISEGSERAAAEKLGITRSAINFILLKIKKRASLSGDAPEHGLTHPVAPGFTTKRVSTAYGEDGGMKDSTFTLNAKLFKEVEVVKKKIRDEIHSKCRGDDSGPSVKSAKAAKMSDIR